MNLLSMPRRIEVVEIEGETVRLRVLSGRDRSRWLQTNKDASGRVELSQATLIALSVVDEQGGRVYSEEDVEKLCDAPASLLDAYSKLALRLNSLSEE